MVMSDYLTSECRSFPPAHLPIVPDGPRRRRRFDFLDWDVVLARI